MDAIPNDDELLEFLAHVEESIPVAANEQLNVDVENVGEEVCAWFDIRDESDLESLYGPSDDLVSLYSSSNDEVAPDEQPRDKEKKKLKLGQKFGTPADFRVALKQVAIDGKFDITYLKNETERITVVCKERCGWRIHASWSPKRDSFQIKSYSSVHNCPAVQQNRQASSSYLANRYLDQFRENPEWNIEAIRSTITRELEVDISRHKVYRTKRKALEIIEGNHGEQYNYVKFYERLILDTNPNSIVRVETERTSVQGTFMFQRMFISLAAMMTGFKEGCRPFIGVDGCFLKGPYGGHLLSAVGQDGNLNMFPIAYAVVEAETRDSWEWFMKLLMDVVGPLDGITFISDRQKGLVPCFEDLLYGVEHRYCVRHMYDNFKKEFKGRKLKNLMWEAATCYTNAEFESRMQEIKEQNDMAHNWLRNVSQRLWSMSRFGSNSKCALVVNNMSEAFNSYVLWARDKPILYMLEWIRRKLMKRFQEKREWMASKNGLLCPTIEKELSKLKTEARKCMVEYAGERKYEVHFQGVNDAVDLGNKTCSCRCWEVIGIPCKHAIACIFMERGSPEEYVHEMYHRETYLKAYAPLIYPMSVRSTVNPPKTFKIIPPPYRKPPGRPKKSINKSNDEAPSSFKLSRHRPTIKCSKCNQLSHNSRTCKNLTPEPTTDPTPTPPPRRGGRPPSRGRGNIDRGSKGVGRGGRGRGSRGAGRGVDNIDAPQVVVMNYPITFSTHASSSYFQ